MAKGYVVLERGSDYNDEIYSLNEGGEPDKVYMDKSQAQARVLALFHKAFSDGFVFSEYCYSLDDLSGIGHDETIQKFNEIVPENLRNSVDENWLEIKRTSKLTEEQTKKLIKLFPRLKLYYIQEVDVV